MKPHMKKIVVITDRATRVLLTRSGAAGRRSVTGLGFIGKDSCGAGSPMMPAPAVRRYSRAPRPPPCAWSLATIQSRSVAEILAAGRYSVFVGGGWCGDAPCATFAINGRDVPPR